MINKTLKKKKKGGSVSSSGGFGCLFIPNLKCKNKMTVKKGEKYVSKLMMKKYAQMEYELINKFKNILQVIPNYDDYFLLKNISVCYNLQEITNDNLLDFDEKCKPLYKNKITSKNINDNLDKIAFLNMPNGGIDVDDYLSDKKGKDYIKFNNSMLKLLKNGIEPMNNLGVYHNDLKGSNILIDDSKKDNIKARIIDWGLSFIYYKSSESTISTISDIPSNITNRNIQFNLPLSIIMFQQKFILKYEEYIKINDNKEKDNLTNFILNYSKYNFETNGNGHMEYVEKILYLLFINDNIDENITPEKYVEIKIKEYYVNYFYEILISYTNINGILEIEKYFNDVFIKNLDIYGFIVSYVYILEDLFNNYNKLNESGIILYNKIKIIFLECLFSNSTKIINKNELINSLKSLNKYFIEIFNKPDMFKFNSIFFGIETNKNY